MRCHGPLIALLSTVSSTTLTSHQLGFERVTMVTGKDQGGAGYKTIRQEPWHQQPRTTGRM
jgi:hypothetical protein